MSIFSLLFISLTLYLHKKKNIKDIRYETLQLKQDNERSPSD